MADGWRQCSLSEVVSLQRGFDLPENARQAGSVPILGSFGITGSHDTAKVSGPGVTIGRSGASIGVATYTTQDYWPLNTTLYVKDFHGNDPRFVYYLLKSLKFAAYNSGSAQPSLNRNYIAHIRLYIPPVAEQRGIAEVLGALDDKMGLDSLIAAWAEELAVALLANIEASVPLRDIATVERRQARVVEFDAALVDNYSLPAFDVNRMPERVHGSTIRSNKFVLASPTVLVSKLNPHIPRVWHAVPGADVMALASTEFVALLPRSGVSSQELWALCRNDAFSGALAVHATGTTGSHQRVRPDDIMALHVSDPRTGVPEVRDAVVQLVNRALLSRREGLALGRLRDALLPRLVSGQIRVREVKHLVEVPV